MIRTEVQTFGVTVDVPFRQAIALFEARLNDFAARLSDAEGGFELRPEQITVKHSDILYGYELRAIFFGGNATIHRTAEHVELRLTGGKTISDSEVVIRTIERFVRLLDMPENMQAAVGVHGHAAFAGVEEAIQFFSSYTPPATGKNELVIRGGALGFVKIPAWPHEIRVTIEPSILFRDGAFVGFNTVISLSDAGTARLHALTKAFGEAGALFGLEIGLAP